MKITDEMAVNAALILNTRLAEGNLFGVSREMLEAALTAAPASAEPVAWRVRVKSDDPEEWTLLPAGGGADYLNRDGYECQPLYNGTAALEAPMLSEAQIHAEASNIIQIAMGKINQVSGDRRRSSRVWAANEDPMAYVMGVEAIVSLVHRAVLGLTPTT